MKVVNVNKKIEEIKMLLETLDFELVEEEEKSLMMQYKDPENEETVSFEVQVNEYNVPKFLLTITKRLEELPFYYGCLDYICEGCEREDQEEICTSCKFNEMAEEEAEKWLNNKPLEGIWFYDEEIKIRPVITATKCYVNIPHNHYYKAVELVLETREFDILKNVLLIRDVFFSFGETQFS